MCRTKNYCSQECRDADDAVHKVCCNPDKGQRRIEERKVKIGGKDKVEAASVEMDSFEKGMSSTLASNLHYHREKMEKILQKTKPRAKKKTHIDEVD